MSRRHLERLGRGDVVPELFDLEPVPPIAEPDPRAVQCPTCHAKPGSPCRRPSGHNVFGGDVHAERRAAAAVKHRQHT
jgi:hypothetical protein